MRSADRLARALALAALIAAAAGCATVRDIVEPPPAPKPAAERK